MSSKLEELFNLPSAKSFETPDSSDVTEDTDNTQEILEVMKKTSVDMDKIDAALPMVVGLEASEREMDELAEMATEGYKNLMELGMNVETRNAAEIFGAASNLLGHALTAKKNKIEKKLKMIELQLKKQRLDLLSHQNSNVQTEFATEGTATVIDRNALIAEILQKNKANSSES